MTIFGNAAAKVSAQPLFLAQMFSSAASAVAMIMAATAMPPDRFTTFSLLTLVTILCSGAARAFLFQPALIEIRNNSEAHIHIRVAIIGAVCSSIAFMAAAAMLGVHQVAWLASLSISNVLPVLTEWLRLRGMAVDERWIVARSDAIRLATTLPGALMLWFTTEPEGYFLFVSITYAPGLAYLARRLPRVSGHLSPLQIWRPASSQFADFVMSQTITTIPLLVLANFGSSAYIGGIRLAQTLLGPLHLVINAASISLLADGATQDRFSDPVTLIRHGRRLAAILSAFCLSLVSVVLLVLSLTHFGFRGVDNRSLVIGVLLTGAIAITTAWSYTDTIVMRLLGHHKAVTIGRALLIIVTAAGYAGGYIFGGADLSLIVAFLSYALVNPLAFRLPASFIYRRYIAKLARSLPE